MNHEMRRKDRAMSPEETRAVLEQAAVGRMGTAGPDGWPYVVPRVFAVQGDSIYFHATTAHGHTWKNVAANPRVCFEVDEPGRTHPTGEESQCDTSIDFASVIVFGTCEVVEDEAERILALDLLMAKYADPSWERPATYGPMLKATAIYRITIERATGKRRPMTLAPRWQDQFPDVK